MTVWWKVSAEHLRILSRLSQVWQKQSSDESFKKNKDNTQSALIDAVKVNLQIGGKSNE